MLAGEMRREMTARQTTPVVHQSAEPHIDRLEPLHPAALTLLAMQDGVPVASAPMGPAGVRSSWKPLPIHTKHLIRQPLSRWIRSSTRVGYSYEFHQPINRLSCQITDTGQHRVAKYLCGIRILLAQHVALLLSSAGGDDWGALKGHHEARHPRAPWLRWVVLPSP